jgi:hypothetical protein
VHLRSLFALFSLFGLLALFVGAALAQPSDAQRNAARMLANEGADRFEAGDYATALERFEAAERLVHAPPHLLFIARAHARLGRLLKARATYRTLADEALAPGAPPLFAEAQGQARVELAALEAQVPAVRVVLKGAAAPEAKVAIDGEPVAPEALAAPVALDPGDHRIAASLPSGRTADAHVRLVAGGGVTAVELVLEAAPPKPPPPASLPAPAPPPPPRPEAPAREGPSPLGPILVLGAGVIGVGVGAVTGALALRNAGELHDVCPDDRPCPTANEAIFDDAKTLATVSTVSFVVGGAALAGGVLWLVLQAGSSSDAGQSAALVVAPGGLGLRF